MCNGRPGERAPAFVQAAAGDHHAEAILQEAEELLCVRHAEALERVNAD
jgi:hypothetical protein